MVLVLSSLLGDGTLPSISLVGSKLAEYLSADSAPYTSIGSSDLVELGSRTVRLLLSLVTLMAFSVAFFLPYSSDQRKGKWSFEFLTDLALIRVASLLVVGPPFPWSNLLALQRIRGSIPGLPYQIPFWIL